MTPSQFDRLSRHFAERKLSRRQALVTGGALAAAGTAGVDFHRVAAEQATPASSPTAENDEHVSYMFVQTFGTGSIDAATEGVPTLLLVADHLAGQTLYFSDRPDRIVGMVPTEKFLGTEAGSSGFGFTESNPPNAALVLPDSKVLVVELIDPKYDSDTGQVRYQLRVLDDLSQIDLELETEPLTTANAVGDFTAASLFIDDCANGQIVCVSTQGDLLLLAGQTSIRTATAQAGAVAPPAINRSRQTIWPPSPSNVTNRIPMANARPPVALPNTSRRRSPARTCSRHQDQEPGPAPTGSLDEFHRAAIPGSGDSGRLQFRLGALRLLAPQITCGPDDPHRLGELENETAQLRCLGRFTSRPCCHKPFFRRVGAASEFPHTGNHRTQINLPSNRSEIVDDRQFDQVARVIGQTTNRRQAIRGLMVLAAGAIGLKVAGADAARRGYAGQPPTTRTALPLSSVRFQRTRGSSARCV